MPARSQRRGFAPRRRPKQMDWVRGFTTAQAIAGANTKSIDSIVVAGTIGLDITIRRVRGLLTIVTDNFAASEQQSGVFGAIMVNEEAFTIGATAVPGPVSDPDAEWSIWMPFNTQQFVYTSASANIPATSSWPFDSKSQRIVRSGGQEQGMLFILETDAGSDGLTFDLALSVLASVRGI